MSASKAQDTSSNTDVVIIGAGIIGIASAYYLKKLSPKLQVTVIDQNPPMTYTSAQSGENYRNWWPHPVMRRFIERSISLMDDIARETHNRIHMNRSGYVLCTREQNISNLLEEISRSHHNEDNQNIRFYEETPIGSYQAPDMNDWQSVPEGIDVLSNKNIIQKYFPHFDKSLKNIIHIRKGGMLDSQQMASFMLEYFKSKGGKLIQGKVSGIDKKSNFTIHIDTEKNHLTSTRVINAAGPFVGEIAAQLDVELPITNVLQQKIAFKDIHHTIPRTQPFSIDLDELYLDWSEDEKQLLMEDEQLASWVQKQPGAVHSRPEGGLNGEWVKLGWAYNKVTSNPALQPELDPYFPDLVLRAASRLNPALKAYRTHLPKGALHYGGYYCMTEENFPLIGETSIEGFYINGAMSGFGTMAACASGELCARLITGESLPDEADKLSLQRYQKPSFINQLRSYNTGIL